MDFTDEGLGVKKQIGYGSFEEAFGYISNYPWHRLHLGLVHPDYRVPVLELLLEQLNREPAGGKYYQERNIYEHQEVLGARICKEATGQWSYTLEDFTLSTPVRLDKEK